MSGFTPGPWQVADAGTWENGIRTSTEYFVRRDGDDVGIANDIMDPDTSQPSEANAHLIAAAPELLHALRSIIEDLPQRRDWLDPALEKEARAAIAKATAQNKPVNPAEGE